MRWSAGGGGFCRGVSAGGHSRQTGAVLMSTMGANSFLAVSDLMLSHDMSYTVTAVAKTDLSLYAIRPGDLNLWPKTVRIQSSGLGVVGERVGTLGGTRPTALVQMCACWDTIAAQGARTQR